MTREQKIAEIAERNERHKELRDMYRTTAVEEMPSKDFNQHLFEIKHITDLSTNDKDYLLSELQTMQETADEWRKRYVLHMEDHRKLLTERNKLIDGLHLWIRKTDDEDTQKYLTRLLEGIGVTV